MPILYTKAVLDANVLYPSTLRDFLLRLAAAQFFKPCWSAEIHEEWIRNLLANNATLSREKLEATHDKMDRYFSDALITGYESLIPTLTNDPKDRHVLAAAIQAEASSIVTFNLKDFSKDALAPHHITAISPDNFVLKLYKEVPQDMISTLRQHRAVLTRPPRTAEEYLEDLTRNHLPKTATALQKHLGEL
jgi:predicted nucleic acid-binding protein